MNLTIAFFRSNFSGEAGSLSLIYDNVAGRLNSKNIILWKKCNYRVRHFLLPFILIFCQSNVSVFWSTKQNKATKIQVISLQNCSKIRSIASNSVLKIIRIGEGVNQSAVIIKTVVFLQKCKKRIFYFRIIKVITKEHTYALVGNMPFLWCLWNSRLFCLIQCKVNTVCIISFLLLFTARNA